MKEQVPHSWSLWCQVTPVPVIHFSASSQKNPSYPENNGLNFVEITVITNQEASEQWNCNLRWIFRNRDQLFTNIGFNKVSTYKNLGWDRYMLSLKKWKILLLLPVITSCRLFPWVEQGHWQAKPAQTIVYYVTVQYAKIVLMVAWRQRPARTMKT